MTENFRMCTNLYEFAEQMFEFWRGRIEPVMNPDSHHTTRAKAYRNVDLKHAKFRYPPEGHEEGMIEH